MAHPRKLIRDAIHALLLNNTSAGENVFKSRIIPTDEKKLPAINIRPFNERSELFNETKRIFKRTLSVLITITATANDDIDDILDEISQEIEDIILVNDTLNDTASDVRLSDTDMRLDFGNKTIGGTAIGFDVIYFTEHVQTFDDFETANVQLKNGSSSEVISESEYQIPTD